MSKSRSFSIYLLKPTHDATNTLKDDHELVDDVDADDLPDDAILYVLDSQPKPPWWRSYFGITKNLQQTLKGAVVFLPVDGRTFAITFGHVYHNLKPESYEYDFGLRVTLNSVDPDKLKSLDSLAPENTRRQRTQLAISSDLTFFDFDRDSTILKSLTGVVREQLKPFFRHATGASNVRISSDVAPDGLPDLCKKLLELYKDETFETAFPDIQNVTPVKDPTTLNALNAKLVDAVKAKDDSVILTVPELIDYSENRFFTFSGVGSGLVYDDIFIDRYYEYLSNAGKNLADLDIDVLRKHALVATDEGGQKRGENPSVLKCLIFDTSLSANGPHFHLCEGNWYEVETDYVASLKAYLDPYCKDTTLINYQHKDEADFNEACAAASPSRLCMDKGNISLPKQKQVEPCDICEFTEELIVLHHVKRSTVSSNLSHLFNQGLNSIQLVRDEEQALENLKGLAADKAPDGQEDDFVSAFDGKNFKVAFHIITHKDKNQKSDNLPLFSRISLKRTIRELRRMGIEAEFCFVENLVQAKDGTKKVRKKLAGEAQGENEAEAA